MNYELINVDMFWNRVDTLCAEKHLNLLNLAEKAAINYGSLKGWRNKHRYPSAEEIVYIAKTLNTSLDYLLTGENTSTLSEEAQAVERDAKLRLLVNTLMHDPHLLEVVSTVNQSARQVDIGKSGA